MQPQPEHLPTAARRAFLVGLVLPGRPAFVVEEHVDELAELARSAGVEVAGRALPRRKAPDAGTFVGSGRAKEIAAECAAVEADLVIFDDDLSPSQVKNLETILDRSVMDRSGLILELFYQRARTREARTQVELAQLNYLLPRLTRRWTHLSRQEGGIAVRGGAGETQLEADRRMLRRRIRHLDGELAKIERTRRVQRRGRRGAPEIALAGYTTAGKSTLFNRLTRSAEHVEDRLFATLDSKVRRGAVDSGRPVLFADTVGFIRKLPHHLVASFRSTLEEVTHADLVLHVIDRSHPQWEEQAQVAAEVLGDLGVEPERVVQVFNKADLDPARPREREPRVAAGPGDALWVSAVTGEGIECLKAHLASRLAALDSRPSNILASTPATAP